MLIFFIIRFTILLFLNSIFPVIATTVPSNATKLAGVYLKSFSLDQISTQSLNSDNTKREIGDTMTAIHLSPRGQQAVIFSEIFHKSNLYQSLINRGKLQQGLVRVLLQLEKIKSQKNLVKWPLTKQAST